MLVELVALISHTQRLHAIIGGYKTAESMSERLRHVANEPDLLKRLIDSLDRLERATTRLGKADVSIHGRAPVGDE